MVVQEGQGEGQGEHGKGRGKGQGESWEEKVGDLPASVQGVIAAGGLERWCRGEIAKSGRTQP